MNKIEFGDCREIMKRWIDEGVKIQTCITSPPYYGLRDYGTATWEGGDINCDHKDARSRGDDIKDNDKQGTNVGSRPNKKFMCECGATRKDLQIGLEQTPKEYIDNMVDVFNHVKELLADDGTLWVNIGDSYARTGGDSSQQGRHWDGRKNNPNTGHNRYASDMGLKSKDLIGIPWMLAFALREAGWYLRQDIIWHKPNPMPESVTDRCTKSHEYIFLLSKSPKYYFDHLAIKEPAVSGKDLGLLRSVSHTDGSKVTWHSPSIQKRKESGIDSKNAGDGMRNKRDVWSVNVRPYKGAHFATYPTALIEPCILAGSPEKICVECNTPYKRQTKIERNLTLEEVEQIRNNIIETNKEKKPYAIIDKEFRNQVIEYRNLPNHDELREYLQSNRNLIGLTIDQIETAFGTQAPHHWFEKGGSYPDKEDWLKLKQMLLLDDKYDKEMTEIFYKSGLKCDNKYLDEGLVKQCKCDTNETKAGIVFDPFMGSGTTAQVALQHGRQYLGCELNKEYQKLQQERINNGEGFSTKTI